MIGADSRMGLTFPFESESETGMRLELICKLDFLVTELVALVVVVIATAVVSQVVGNAIRLLREHFLAIFR